MKRVLYLIGPPGLALLVVGSGWLALAPRIMPQVYWGLLLVGAGMTALSAWGRRDTMFARGGVRKLRLGAGALATVGVTTAILLLVNFFAARYQERWDLTRYKAFSLHPTTLRVLKQVDRDVDVVAFFPSTEQLNFRAVKQLYDLFHFEQPKVRINVVDPNKSPDLYAKLDRPGNKVTVVMAGERKVVFPGFEEKDLTAALAEVSRSQPKVVYWVIGHGEAAINATGGSGYGRLIKDLRHEFIEIMQLSLASGEMVPPDASLVVFANPRKPLTPGETQSYERYLRAGGRILVLMDVDPGQDPTVSSPMASLLENWGLRPLPALVLDPRARTGDPDPRTVIGDKYPHESVSALNGQMTVFRQARPIEFFQVMQDQQIFHHVIAQVAGARHDGRDPFVTKDMAFATAPVQALANLVSKEPMEAPINLIMTAFRKFPPPPGQPDTGMEARIAVAGDADFANDANYDMESNRELVLNMVRWLTGKEMLIRRQGEVRYAKQAMAITPEKMNVVLALVIGFPVIIFLAGSVVWILRRSK